MNGSGVFAGYYGVNLLPPLYGPHADAVETMLSKYVEEHVVSCADWRVFEGRAGVVAGLPKVTVVLSRSPGDFASEDSFALELVWQVNVTAGGVVVPLEKFSARIPVRLATTYYLAKEVVDADVSDVVYVPRVPAGFTIKRESVGNESVLRLADVQSKVNNLPFEVVLARKNRLPALWQINESLFADKTFHISAEGKGAEVIVEDRKLIINDPCPDGPNPFVVALDASDPDEDVIRFEVEVPGSSDARLPKSAIGMPYKITILASDGSIVDFQKIPLKVSLCEVR